VNGPGRGAILSIRDKTKKYMVSFSMAYAPALFTDGSFLEVLAMNAAFGKKKAEDFTFMHLVALDSNNEIIPLLSRLYCGNDNKTHGYHLLLLPGRTSLPFLKVVGFTVIFDAQKGMATAIQEVVPNLKDFICNYHKKNSSKLNQKAKKLVGKLMKARTVEKANFIMIGQISRFFHRTRKVSSNEETALSSIRSP